MEETRKEFGKEDCSGQELMDIYYIGIWIYSKDILCIMCCVWNMADDIVFSIFGSAVPVSRCFARYESMCKIISVISFDCGQSTFSLLFISCDVM